MFAVESVKNILIRQQKQLPVFLHIVEDIISTHFLTDSCKIHQQHAGIVISFGFIRRQSDFVDRIGDVHEALVDTRRIERISEILFIQGADGIDDEHVRIKIENAIQVLWQQLCSQQTVVHGAGIVAQRGRVGKPFVFHMDQMQCRMKPPAEI